THLVLKFGKDADVMHPALLIESGHRLGAYCLAPAGDHFLESRRFVRRGYGEAHHVAAEVPFGDNPVGLEPMIEINGPPPPTLRREVAGAVVKHVSVPVDATSSNDDTDIIGALVASRAGRVH